MPLNPYLFLANGQCETAFQFYAQVLGGQIVMMMRNEDAPADSQGPESMRHSIIHARLVVGDGVLMGSDCPDEYYEKPQGFSVSYVVGTPEEAERIFAALSENGRVTMPMAETFWATRFGMLVDQYGIPWMVNCEKSA